MTLTHALQTPQVPQYDRAALNRAEDAPAAPWEPLKMDAAGRPRVPWSWWDRGQDGRDQ